MIPRSQNLLLVAVVALLAAGCGDPVVELPRRDGAIAQLDAGESGPDAAEPGEDAATADPDAGVPGEDASIATPDSGPSGEDAALPGEDASLPGPDAALPGEDAALAGPDAALPGEDASLPGPDAALPGEDASTPGPDASVAAEDAALPGPDASLPGPDASLPGPDASLPGPDASLAGPDAGEPSCGNGTVEPPEECEPPSTATCSAQCRSIALCGNNIIDGTEQCDDTDLPPANLDGCDQSCRYEMVLRATSFSLQGGAAPAHCTPAANRLGSAFTATARTVLNQLLQTALGGGQANLLFPLVGLDDPTGVSDPDGLEIGAVTALPDPTAGAWPGGTPLDFPFWAYAGHLGPDGLPLSRLANGTLSARALGAGPSDITLDVPGIAPLRMRAARVRAAVDAVPAPSRPAPPPAVLAAGFTAFESLSAAQAGLGLCGNVTVESLASVPIPEAFASGATPCLAGCSGSKSYTSCGVGPVTSSCNSLLDVLVGGCAVGSAPYLCISLVGAAQPDVPAAGAVQTLSGYPANLNKVPASQTAGNLDGYSSYFWFKANRAHITGTTP